MSDEEENLGPAEVMRRWHLPGDHPESWVQCNATYRGIHERAYAAGYSAAREDAATVADEMALHGQVPSWHAETVADAIRALSPK